LRVGLIKVPATYADWYKRPVLGLAQLASCLQEQGIECRIFDAYFHSWTESDLIEAVRDFAPDLIGFTAMTHEVKEAVRIAGILKADLEVPAVIGGCHVTALPEQTFHEFPVFDYGIRGEAERAVKELVGALERGDTSNLGAIDGLIFREQGAVIVNREVSPLTSEELDQLPMPSFHDYYLDDPEALAGRDCVYPIVTSRGCPYNCAFCMRMLGKKVRRRSPEKICEEMEAAIEKWGAHTFDFYDDIMLHDDAVSRRLLDLMIEKGLPGKIRWCGTTRADLVKPDLVGLARKAGCFRLGIGVESGDDDILKSIGKAISADKVRKAVATIKDAGIAVDAYFILGHPNETEATVKKTVDLAVELNPHMIAVGLMVPYPGTRIFEMARLGEGGYRLLSEDWSQYDKYGGRTLEVAGMSYDSLTRWQRKAYLDLYLKNFRPFDLLKYVWKRRRALRLLVRGVTRRSQERSGPAT
jgi:anaerobic magnesium-protoporphyrin IX monomethyl ester cyclase